MMPRRPALRYYGSKWRIAPWIVGHFAPHELYVDPCGGGVLLRKRPSGLDVYNDLDSEVVNFFQVLRDHAAELLRRIRPTPFARAEWEVHEIISIAVARSQSMN
jgi:DNA adenine methylase